MKILLFLLLPFFVFASDIKFAVADSLGDNAKEYAAKVADVINEELDIKLIKNFESKIYEDEAALYAVKSGLIKFAIVRGGLFDELGLVKDGGYGFERITEQDGLVLVVQSRFWDSIEKNKRELLAGRLKKLKKLN